MIVKNWKIVACVVLAFALANVYFALRPCRIDMTAERRFTLSDSTLRVLHGLGQPVTADVFMSRSVPGVPPSLQSYCDYVDKILSEYERNGGGRLRLRYYDPVPGSAAEERAMRSGMQFEELRPGDAGSRFCLGVCFRRLGRGDVSLRQLVTGGYNSLEYDLTRGLMRIASEKPVTIGVMSAMPVFGGIDAERHQSIPEWAIVTALRDCSFNVAELPGQLSQIPEAVDILLMLHPEELSEGTQRAVDGFVQRGGRLLAFLDSGCWTAAMYKGGASAFDSVRPSGLGVLPKAWGVTFERDSVVLDKSQATIVLNKKSVPESHIEWLTLGAANMARRNPVTSFLKKVELYQAGYFTCAPVAGLTAEALVSSADTAQSVTTAHAFRHQRALLKDYVPGGKALCLGLSLTGEFPSAFEPGKVSKPTQVLLFGDADAMHDNFTRERKTDNMQLLLNCADCLRETDDGLLRLRNRSFVNRTLTWLAQKEARNRTDYQKKLDEFQKGRDQLAADAAALEKSRGGRMFSDVEGDKLKGMYDRLLAADQELRALQIASNRRMEGYRQRIVLLNILLGPGLLLLVLLTVPFCRMMRADWRLGLRRTAWCAGCLLALCAVACAFRYAGRQSGGEESVRGSVRLLTRPLKRDQLARVEIRRGDWAAVLVRQGDGWQLEGRNGYPADVRQLNNFLESVNVCTGEALSVTDAEKAAVMLDGSGFTVRLIENGGHVAELVFGDWRRNYQNEPQGRYVVNDAGQTLLTGYSFAEVGGQGAWLQKTLPGFDGAAKRIVRESEFKDLSWGLDRRPGGYEVRGKVPQGYVVNDAVVKNILSNFQRMAVLDIQTAVEGFAPETRLTIIGGDDILYEYELGKAGGRWYAHLLDAQSVGKAEEARACRELYGKFYLEVSEKLAGTFKRNRKDLFKLKR